MGNDFKDRRKSVLTDADKDWIKKARAEGSCSCGIDPIHRAQMGHFWGMLTDESNGNPSIGVEHLRNVIQSDKRAREWSKVVVRASIGVIVTTFVGGIIAAVWRMLTR
jgi:hypothetical protein